MLQTARPTTAKPTTQAMYACAAADFLRVALAADNYIHKDGFDTTSIWDIVEHRLYGVHKRANEICTRTLAGYG
jgi:hypothetical protein